jgi:hypothetical protein
MSWISVDIDLEDVYDEMGQYDKEKMAEWLMEDGILENHPSQGIRLLIKGQEESFGEEQLRNDLTKLWNNYYQLSNEDIEIKRIYLVIELGVLSH